VVSVGEVQAGGGDVVELLAFAGLGLGDVDDLQDLRTAKRVICTARIPALSETAAMDLGVSGQLPNCGSGGRSGMVRLRSLHGDWFGTYRYQTTGRLAA
jgi:hypothetical protein